MSSLMCKMNRKGHRYTCFTFPLKAVGIALAFFVCWADVDRWLVSYFRLINRDFYSKKIFLGGVVLIMAVSSFKKGKME